MSDAYALRLHGLTKSFGGVTALDGVSFDVRAGEVHCIAGENGCGKSTLIKLVTGVYAPDAADLIELVRAASQRHHAGSGPRAWRGGDLAGSGAVSAYVGGRKHRL